MSDPTQTARRKVLVIGAATLAGGALTACGGGGDGGSAATGEPNGAATPPPGSAPADAPSAGGAAAGTKSIAQAADVPVGGGKVLKEEKLVVTQPTAGSFRCFTAVCPHQGCLVSKVADNTINCACHNSEFKATDGSKISGPATKGLAEKKITVSADGNIALA
ncbi:Rieske (2Fe-2S) protein [Streptomyces sp. NPDC090021]|uniref:Rieske (2Fe-2S) protein n=1 Tax=Streptomyces sp. NPDC090021 TaxID=3365919 RepID=UPI0037F8040A